MTDVFSQIVSELIAAGVDSPRLEARMMIGAAAGIDADKVGNDTQLSEAQYQNLQKMLKRRAAHEPLDKILGYRDFYKYRFVVDGNVLSPRPDSEILAEAAIKIARSRGYAKILELGVGSGCLILSILAEFPNMRGVGCDKSAAALKIAAQNAENLNLSNRIKLLQADYFGDLPFSEKFPLIISNPPYIATAEIAALDAEVKNYDPTMALDGGADGYEHYRRIAQIVPQLLEKGGFMLLEVGQGQADEVADIFAAEKLHLVEKIRDLNGIERCVVLRQVTD